MGILGYLAASLVGLPIGIYTGRLLNAVLHYWEGTAVATKATKGAIAFALGGGAGAIIFGHFGDPGHAFLYLIALGLGLIWAFFFAKVPNSYSLQTFKKIVRLDDELRAALPDPEKRALLILATFAPPKVIERSTGMDQAELARQLEQATDSLDSATRDESDA